MWQCKKKFNGSNHQLQNSTFSKTPQKLKKEKASIDVCPTFNELFFFFTEQTFKNYFELGSSLAGDFLALEFFFLGEFFWSSTLPLDSVIFESNSSAISLVLTLINIHTGFFESDFDDDSRGGFGMQTIEMLLLPCFVTGRLGTSLMLSKMLPALKKICIVHIRHSSKVR